MNIAEAPESAPPASQDPVTRRYQPQACPTDGDGRNLDRVRLLMRLFGLSISEVAKAGGVTLLEQGSGREPRPQSRFLEEAGGEPGKPG